MKDAAAGRVGRLDGHLRGAVDSIIEAMLLKDAVIEAAVYGSSIRMNGYPTRMLPHVPVQGTLYGSTRGHNL